MDHTCYGLNGCILPYPLHMLKSIPKQQCLEVGSLGDDEVMREEASQMGLMPCESLPPKAVMSTHQ